LGFPIFTFLRALDTPFSDSNNVLNLTLGKSFAFQAASCFLAAGRMRVAADNPAVTALVCRIATHEFESFHSDAI
jgi:hypothetical protein